MTLEFRPDIRDLTAAQDGVLSRGQALGHGLDCDAVRGQIAVRGNPDVRTPRSQCETAAEVAGVLRDRGP
ncbi:MAG TPA: hypothetical protein VK817_05305 [Trebonia sp.]|jgi:hypothetical protein|nr:hypothetical protein [Trebonia sp.]